MNIISPELKNAISENKLIIFGGAGLSSQFDFPDWKTLVCNIIKRVSAQEPGVEAMLPAIEAGYMTPISALNELKKYKKDVLLELSESFKLNGDNNYSKHKKILELSGKVITTNFDKVFEKASESFDLDMIPYKSDFKVSQLNGKEKFLFKIHGCIDYPEDCILFEEQYEEHYNEANSSVFELKKIISSNTILFLGFSLSDPFVKAIFSFINSIYKGYDREHYVVTTDVALEKEIGISSIKTLLIDDYEEGFEDLIDKLISFKTDLIKDDSSISKVEVVIKSKPSICILIPDSIDKQCYFNSHEIANSFSKYDVILDVNYLSIEVLRELKAYDYLLIFSNNVKNKLLIEDEYLKSKFIPIEDIEGNIDNSYIKFLAVFYLGKKIVYNDSFSIPHIFVPVEGLKFKETLKGFNYKVFSKGNIEQNSNIYTVTNKLEKIEPLKRGAYLKVPHIPKISKYIDQKLLSKFVGRKTDLENIIRKIIDNQYNSSLLVIKGSGGIGKTTIICKAAIELANRKYFSNGIHFIACHSIESIEKFYYQISHCFNLSNSIELKSQIQENFIDKSTFIILDNFETLLNSEDRGDILDLVSFIIDYATVVVTTRQILDLEYEDVYELRNFTTDEGVQLFKLYHPYVNVNEEKILREQIVEKILNNNPLAIKLIAKGLVKSKSLFKLKEELEENLFRDEDLEKIFEKPEDINIEKTYSLYQSINYSYKSLTVQEKLAFELLSLFPDGIHLENFKKFLRQSKNNKLYIGEKEIKSLDNKSMLENTRSFIKLQSIISRFADYQFSLKSEEQKNDYVTMACDYNNYFLKLLESDAIGHNLAIKIFDDNTNNYLKILDSIEYVNIKKSEKIIFIVRVIEVFRQINQPNEIYKRIEYLQEYFKDEEDLILLLTITLLVLKYWTTEFEDTFQEIQKLYPIDNINTHNMKNAVEHKTCQLAISIYGNEGKQYELVIFLLENDDVSFTYLTYFFQLGYINESYKYFEPRDFDNFFYFECKSVYNEVNQEEVNDCIRKIHKKESLQIIQVLYFKQKYFGNVANDEIRKLIVTNPYSKGLINLMYALNESDNEKKNAYFVDSLNLLKHIKYYYLDAMILYCQFLKEYDLNKYNKQLSIGFEIAEKFKYRYLLHKLNCLKTSLESPYFEEDYEEIFNIEKIRSYLKRVL